MPIQGRPTTTTRATMEAATAITMAMEAVGIMLPTTLIMSIMDFIPLIIPVTQQAATIKAASIVTVTTVTTTTTTTTTTTAITTTIHR